MSDKTGPVFLERESYRRRRRGDAARLVPFFGLVLLLLPAFWSTTHRTADAIVYIFTVWALLIVTIGLLSRHLARGAEAEETAGDAADAAGER